MGFDEMDALTIWQSGEYKDRKDTTVYVLTHGLYHGTGAFEGVRAYDADRGPAAFRQGEHLEWLYQSTKPYNMEIPYTREGLTEATLEVIRRNDLDGGYARPIAFYNYDSLGVNLKDSLTEVAIVARSWGTYLGENTLENGVGVTISSWHRHAYSQIPINAKMTGLYVNSMSAGGEARRNDYVEAIVLNKRDNVTGGPGESVFMTRDGKIRAPGLSQSIFDDITRDTVITLAREHGYEVDNSAIISHGEPSTADELLFTGSATEVTPIRKVGNIVIGEGARGSVMEELQSAPFGLVEHHADDHEEWLTYVDEQ